MRASVRPAGVESWPITEESVLMWDRSAATPWRRVSFFFFLEVVVYGETGKERERERERENSRKEDNFE